MRLVSEKSTGAVLLLGFAWLVVGALIAPSGAYSGSIDDRLAVIAAAEGRWQVSKLFDSIAVVFGVGGMVMLALVNSRRHGGWLNTTGAVAFGLGGVAGLVWTYLLATDPGPLYDRDTPAPVVVMFIVLVAVGLLSFGLHYLRFRYPRWLGWGLTAVGSAVLVAVAAILLAGGGPESAFGLGSLMYLAILTVGIRLTRRGAQPPAPRSRDPGHTNA